MDDARTIRVDQFLAHSPARVWRALTDSRLLEQWLMPNDFELTVGHHFTFTTNPIPSHDFDGRINCQVLGFESERMLRISWGGGRLDTTVTWKLEPEGRGTRLFVIHDGFDPDDPIQQLARRGMGSGWRSGVLRGLEKCLAELEHHGQ